MRPSPTSAPAPLAALAALAVLAAPASFAADPPSGAAAARCRITAGGSRAAAACRNPGPEPLRAQLHISCRRWWDPAVDTRPTEVAPGRTAVLTGRCWKEIGDVWVTVTRR